MKHKQGFSAWLVTREGSEGDAESQDKVVEILSPRMSPKRVREIVELLYHREATLSEKVAWRLRKQSQPYAAKFLMIEGVRWEGQIICGHNPWLCARLVDNLIIDIGADGKETASWNDRNTPRKTAEKVHQMLGSDE